MYRGKVLCPECYDTRLDRKAAKKAELKARAEEVRKMTTPTRKARKKAKKYGLDLTVENKEIGDEDETAKTAEDTR